MVDENLYVGNNLYAQNGLNVGPGGLHVDSGEVGFDADSGDTAFRFGQSGTGDILNVFDGSTEVLTILDGGNVGIGTTSPAYELQVNGDVVSETDSTDALGDSSIYWANSYIDRMYVNSTAYIDGSTAGDLTITGDLVPSATNTYDLGSSSNYWNALYLNGSTIYFDDTVDAELGYDSTNDRFTMSNTLGLLESSGSTYYGLLSVGDLSDNRTYTFPDTGGEVTLLGQTIEVGELATSSLSVNSGSGLTGGGSVSLGGSTTISHDDTSSQSSSDNSGRTYIQDITLDGFGHITGLVTATETVTDTNTQCDDIACTLSDETITSGSTIALNTSSSTGEGALRWDATNDRLVVGTGSSTATFYSGAHTADTNYYVTGVSFNTSDGVLTLTRNGGLGNLTADLDGRYALSAGDSMANDILLTQEVRNNSLEAMKGSFGLESGDFVEKVSATQFNTGSSSDISSTTLENGNVFVAYRDAGNSHYGTFVIYDSSGAQVRGETVFASAASTYVNATTLTNGNVVIVYRDEGNSYYGSFVIYDSAGNLVKSETVFASTNTTYPQVVAMTNGNFFIAYRDVGSSNSGMFVIYDSAGDVVRSATSFNTATLYLSATSLTNGNILISYCDVGNSYYGTFAIYDSAGELVKSETVYNSGTTYYIDAVTLNNGNVVMTYSDASNSNRGSFVIYDLSGNLITSETVYNTGNTVNISATPLADGNVLVGYTDEGNLGRTTFVIYDSTGNQVKSETVADSGYSLSTSVTTLTSGDVVLAYANSTGYLEIWGSEGATFSGDINFTGKLLEDGVEVFSGVIAAFNGSCPTGWTEYTAARGRVVVGTPSGGTNGGTLGTALTNLQVPTHTHTGTTNNESFYDAGSWSASNRVGEGAQRHTHSFTTNANTTTPIPYIQLTYCQKSAGSDLAEWLPTDQDISSATIVSVDPDSTEKAVVTTKEYDNSVIGVVASSPGWLIGVEEEGAIQLALAGRVPVRVSLKNGDIENGDPITTSTIPGVGMKASRPGTVIGKAMESLDSTNATDVCVDPDTGISESCGEMVVFINLSWYEPEEYLADLDSMLADYKDGALDGLSGGISVDGWTFDGSTISTLSDVTASMITATQGVYSVLKTQSLEVGDHMFFVDSEGNIDVAGDILLAGVLKGWNGDVTIQLDDSEGNSRFAIKNSDDQEVFGVDSRGGITLNDEVEDASVGTSTIVEGETEIRVNTLAMVEGSRVFITPVSVGDDIPVLGVKETGEGYFIVKMDKARDEDIKFDWWIIK
ncbi:hypothetical protein JW710_04525 [Candidatus Dojkabacteria bacterium]|nr:hypothetical protein [Candidatus Dojkabacteria bacterium]